MNRLTILSLTCLGLAACSEPPPPTPVDDFVEDKALLDQVIVRCAQNPGSRKTDAECVNARRAIDILAAREEEARRQQLEAESERKRDALRQRKEREQRRLAEYEARAKQEAAEQAATELIGDSTYAVEPGSTLPASTPPGVAMAEDGEPLGVRATQPLQPDLCRLDPGAMADDELMIAYQAIQRELQRRQTSAAPVPPPADSSTIENATEPADGSVPESGQEEPVGDEG